MAEQIPEANCSLPTLYLEPAVIRPSPSPTNCFRYLCSEKWEKFVGDVGPSAILRLFERSGEFSRGARTWRRHRVALAGRTDHRHGQSRASAFTQGVVYQ